MFSWELRRVPCETSSFNIGLSCRPRSKILSKSKDISFHCFAASCSKVDNMDPLNRQIRRLRFRYQKVWFLCQPLDQIHNTIYLDIPCYVCTLMSLINDIRT